MNTIEKIREVLGLPKTTLYAEVKIDDGRVLVTEAEAFEPGVEVRVLDESGSTVEVDAGTYTLEDGRMIVISEDSRMESFESDEEEEEVEVEVEMEEVDVEVEEEEEMEDEEKEEEEFNFTLLREKLEEKLPDLDEAAINAVAEAVAEVVDAPAEEIKEVIEEKVEASSEELASAFAEAFEALNNRLEALENAPASQGVSVSPNNFSAQHKQKDITKLNGVDRALHIIQNSHR